jgi:hypothetical protein
MVRLPNLPVQISVARPVGYANHCLELGTFGFRGMTSYLVAVTPLSPPEIGGTEGGSRGLIYATMH